MTIHLEQPLSRYTVTADNSPGNSVARPSVVSVDVFVVKINHEKCCSVDELIIFVFRRQQRQQRQQKQQQQLFCYNSNLPLSR